MSIVVMGAGSWGTALALQLGRSHERVLLLDHNASRAVEMQNLRENQRYLPGVSFPETLAVMGMDTPEGIIALGGARIVVSVIPSQASREVLSRRSQDISPDAVVCCASKGIEQGTLMSMDEVFRDVLPAALHDKLCFLAGPSFAKEVARSSPTAVVVASRNEDAAHAVAAAFHDGNLRVYHTDDVVGAEFGGALKNIIAIACGVADGIGLGLNARAALITRGLAELTRLAVHRGANPMTLSGLAGMGDLVLTCTGDLSRNRRVGLGLAAGKTLDEILVELGEVAEGVMTTQSAWELAQQTGVQMPITEQIYAMLVQGKPAAAALRDLMGRERRAERG